MCFKVDFINFFRRSLRFGAILSDRFDHILIGEKIDIFDENCENGRFCFSHISMKTAPTEKTGYTTTKPTENARKLSSQNFDFRTFVTEIFRFKVSHFSFFQNFQKTQILTILAAKLRALPEHLNQSQQVENDPRYMCFKVDFINFFRRSLRFGAILSDRFDHILIGEKIDIFDENCENGRFCFSHISMKTESPIKVGGSKTYLSDRPRRCVGKQTRKIISKGQILLCKITLFFAIFSIFWPFLPFFGYFWAIFGQIPDMLDGPQVANN